jgi:hypothetical protein
LADGSEAEAAMIKIGKAGVGIVQSPPDRLGYFWKKWRVIIFFSSFGTAAFESQKIRKNPENADTLPKNLASGYHGGLGHQCSD